MVTVCDLSCEAMGIGKVGLNQEILPEATVTQDLFAFMAASRLNVRPGVGVNMRI
jgi:hypothetical protein